MSRCRKLCWPSRSSMPAVNGSLSSLRDVCQLLESSNEAHLLFLPVFYHNLDAQKIPSADEMDTETLPETILSTITRAFLALRGMYNYPSPPFGSHVFIWRRVWPWMQFFRIHHPPIPRAPTPDALSAVFFLIFSGLWRDDTVDEISGEPGVRVLVAQAWAFFLQASDYASSTGFHGISRFLSVPWARDRFCFQELTDGAGSVGALAELVTQHMKCLARELREINQACFRGILLLMAGPEPDEVPPLDFDTWISCLVEHGFVSALVSTLLVTGHHAARAIFDPCFDLLVSILSDSGESRPEAIEEALEAGLLRVIILQAGRQGSVGVKMGYLLNPTIQSVGNYYSALDRLEVLLPKLEDVASTGAFIHSTIYPRWQTFVGFIQARLSIKKHFDSEGYVTLKACDNMQCGKICKKAEFKRCSGCKSQHYCSRDCQVADWRAGHRADCREIPPLNGPKHLTSRDRSFLRAVVRHDYERYRRILFHVRVQRMSQYPGKPLLTILDYTGMQPQPLAIQPVPEPTPPEMAPYVARAARSGNRMDLTRVHVTGKGNVWMLPMRSSSSRAYDGLSTITYPLDVNEVDELAEQVRTEVVEIF
ncbi:hypothetical protein FB451DRAFT_1237638 [Mycena latifolia]|nr:hypothetical protein FB451DRAFT_1237638 [Mycena latifolia]